MAKEMIPGGATDQVRLAGGEALLNAFNGASASQPIGIVAYAVIRMLANIGLMFDDKAEADAFITQVAADAVNELDLNWADRKALIADAIASTSTEVGHG